MIPQKVHVPAPTTPKPALFGVAKRPAKPVKYTTAAPAPWLKNNSIPSRLEYENPDLTQPSVSSF